MDIMDKEMGDAIREINKKELSGNSKATKQQYSLSFKSLDKFNRRKDQAT